MTLNIPLKNVWAIIFMIWFTNQRRPVEHEEQDELQVTQRSQNQTLREHNLIDTSSWSTEDQPLVKRRNIVDNFKAIQYDGDSFDSN